MSRIVGSVRVAVAEAAAGQPTLQEWLDRIGRIDDARVREAVAGIWTGREGRVQYVIEGSGARMPGSDQDRPGTERVIVVGWYDGKVEYSYVS
jgi:hypothetical protein